MEGEKVGDKFGSIFIEIIFAKGKVRVILDEKRNLSKEVSRAKNNDKYKLLFFCNKAAYTTDGRPVIALTPWRNVKYAQQNKEGNNRLKLKGRQ